MRKKGKKEKRRDEIGNWIRKGKEMWKEKETN